MNRPLLCVFLLISATACGTSDRRTFRPVDRASKAIQMAMDGKADLPQYRELLNTFTAELAAVRPHVTSFRGRQAMAEYDAASKNLTDLELVWEGKDTRQSEMLPIGEEVTGQIAREYELPVNTNEPPSIYADEAMQAIKEAARGHLRAASQALGFGS